MWVRREKANAEKRGLHGDMRVVCRSMYKMRNDVFDARKDRDEALRNLDAASANLRKLQGELKEHNYILKSLVEKKGGLAMVAVTACNMNLEHLREDQEQMKGGSVRMGNMLEKTRLADKIRRDEVQNDIEGMKNELGSMDRETSSFYEHGAGRKEKEELKIRLQSSELRREVGRGTKKLTEDMQREHEWAMKNLKDNTDSVEELGRTMQRMESLSREFAFKMRGVGEINWEEMLQIEADAVRQYKTKRKRVEASRIKKRREMMEGEGCYEGIKRRRKEQ